MCFALSFLLVIGGFSVSALRSAFADETVGEGSGAALVEGKGTSGSPSTSNGNTASEGDSSVVPGEPQNQTPDDGSGGAVDDGEQKAVVSAALYLKTADDTKKKPYKSDEETPLALDKSGASVLIDVLLTYEDGTTAFASQVGATLSWDLQQGEKQLVSIEKVVSADDQASGWKIAALKAGNGTVTLSVAGTPFGDVAVSPFSEEKPALGLVVSNNESSGNSGSTTPSNPQGGQTDPLPGESDTDPTPAEILSVVSAVMYYKNSDMEKLEPYESATKTPLRITEREGSCLVDAMLVLADGRSVLASEVGVDIAWTLTTSQSKGIVSVEPAYEGEGDQKKLVGWSITALGLGNGTARVHADLTDYPKAAFIPFSSMSSTVAVRVTGNDATIVPTGCSVLYSDWLTTASTSSYREDEPPTIVMRGGSMTDVRLYPRIAWSDGSARDPSNCSYKCTYSVAYSTDLEGNPVGSSFAWVNSQGVVSANGEQSGFVYVRCQLSSTEEGRPAFEKVVKVAVYSNKSYVTALEIVDQSLEPVGSGVVLESGVNLAQFYAKVTYMRYDSDSRTQVKEVVYSSFEDVPGLTWAVYRGDTTEVELYSTIDESGSFHALSGFSQARIEAMVEGGGYFGQSFSTSIRVTREIDEEAYGHSSVVTVRFIHESDYKRMGGAAPIAYEETITADQMAALGSPYSDWFTFRSRGENWGTYYAYGISITSFLHLVGLDASDLRFIEFEGTDGYTATDGFYSADAILSTRYRYSNYYMHKVSTSSSYLGQGNVAAMLVLSCYYDPGNDYDAGKFAKMSVDSTIRVMVGMSGSDSPNAARSVRCIGAVTLIIADQPDEDTSGGEGGGGGAQGGGSGSDSGAATQGSSGGVGTGGDNSALQQSAHGGVLRELTEAEQLIIQQAVIKNPFAPWALALAILALLAGAYCSRRRFKKQTSLN